MGSSVCRRALRPRRTASRLYTKAALLQHPYLQDRQTPTLSAARRGPYALAGLPSCPVASPRTSRRHTRLVRDLRWVSQAASASYGQGSGSAQVNKKNAGGLTAHGSGNEGASPASRGRRRRTALASHAAM